MAEQTISANLKAIAADIKNIGEQSTKAAKQTRAVNDNLKIDPTNVGLVVERFTSLRTQLDKNNQLAAAYRNALTKVSEIEKKLDKNSKTYAEDLGNIQRLQTRYTAALENTEISIRSLSAATDKHLEKMTLMKTAVAQIEKQYELLISVSTKVASAIMRIATSLKSVATESISTGTELYSLSKKYNTSVEDIQQWNNALKVATGQSDLYSNSLSVMVKGMSQIAAGRGVAYTNALKNIGLSYSELAGLDTSAQFEKIVEGLSNVTNESDRLSYANTLLGDSGQYVSAVLGEGSEALANYLEQAESFGVITTDEATALKDLSVQYEEAQSKLTEIKAELTIALAPAFEALVGLLEEYVIPAIESLSKILSAFGETGQKIIVGITVLLVLLPKVITVIKAISTVVGVLKVAIKGATVAAAGFSAATAGWQIILVAVAAVIIGIIALIGTFSKSASKAVSQVNDLASAANALSGSGADFTTTTESVVQTSTNRTIDVNVDIYGEGDTTASDETAEKVAELTADKINRALGDLVK